MDVDFRGIDQDAYESLKAYAHQQGLSLGAALSELIMTHIDETAKPING